MRVFLLFHNDFVVSENMSVQKVLRLRTQPPCKIVWCLQDRWMRFSRLDLVAVFHSIAKAF
jgi:hypothetical protein